MFRWYMQGGVGYAGREMGSSYRGSTQRGAIVNVYVPTMRPDVYSKPFTR